MILQRLREERGVAALTVMLVTSVLAAAGAVVAFTATAELEIAGRDRRAEDAFAAAEAGLDQAATHFSVQATWSRTRTFECLNNPLVADSAEYREPTNNQVCGVRITSPSNGRIVRPATGRPFVEYTVVSRAKEGRTVTRTLAGRFRVEALNIPFGMFVNGNVDLNGTPKLMRESLLVTGTVTSREKLSTDANGDRLFNDADLAWEFHRDLITSDPAPTMCSDGTGQVGCAGVFSNVQIYEKNEQNGVEIHTQSSDPSLSAYPIDRDYVHQGLVVNGVKQPVVRIPADDILEQMPLLKQQAGIQGLYLNYRNGKNENVVIQPNDLGAAAREFSRQVVVYIDADAGDSIGWKVNLIPGSTSSDIRFTDPDTAQRVGPDAGIIVVRGGSMRLEANTQWSGALFVPESTLRILGGAVCTCTIYAQGFTAEGGNSTVQLTPEWFTRVPGGLFDVRRLVFLECEPFQQSAVCPAS